MGAGVCLIWSPIASDCAAASAATRRSLISYLNLSLQTLRGELSTIVASSVSWTGRFIVGLLIPSVVGSVSGAATSVIASAGSAADVSSVGGGSTVRGSAVPSGAASDQPPMIQEMSLCKRDGESGTPTCLTLLKMLLVCNCSEST